MKYEVGDTVRVREDLVANKSYGGNVVTRGMTKHLGSICKIKEVLDTGYKLDLKSSSMNWTWTDQMLDPLIDERGLPIFETDQSHELNPLFTQEGPRGSVQAARKKIDMFDAVRHGFEGLAGVDNGLPHTPHYTNGLIETIDVIKMALTEDEFRGFLKGNVLKYELRAPYKHETPDEDYQKAKDYFDLLEAQE